MNTNISAHESIEMAAWGDWYRSACEESVEAFGLQVAEIAGALVTIAAKTDVLALNRVIGLGRQRPATERDLEEIVRLFEESGAARFFIQVGPDAQPSHLPQMLEARGFRHHNNWVRLERDNSPPPDVETDLSVREIDAAHAEDFARIVTRSFQWGESDAHWAGDAVGRPGWRHYMAFDDETPVATAAFFAEGELAWFDFAATLPEYRKQGAQSALLARRIRDAMALGCRRLTVETAEQTAEKSSPSYRNMLRFGFREVYMRPNFLMAFGE